MAFLADLIADESCTGSDGHIVDRTGSAADGKKPWGLTTRPIGGPWKMVLSDLSGTQQGINGYPLAVRGAVGARAAFGGFVVSEEEVRTHALFSYGIHNDLVITGSTNGGTTIAYPPIARASTGTDPSGSAYIETRDTIRYTPGQGVVARFTAVFHTASDDSIQEAGLCDDIDGFFFGYSGSEFGICHRNSGSENWTLQADWNHDPMDGNGPSGVSLNPLFGNVYYIQMQYLGYGGVRFAIENPENADFELVHLIKYSNANLLPTLTVPILPVRIKVQNKGSTINHQLDTASMAAAIEGRIAVSNIHGSARNRVTNVSGTLHNVVTIKNKTAFRGITNRIRVHIHSLSLSAGGNKDAQFALIKNANVSAASFVDFDANESVISVDKVGSLVTNGKEIFSSVVNSTQTVVTDLNDYAFYLDPGETMTIAAQTFTAGTIEPQAAISWAEEF